MRTKIKICGFKTPDEVKHLKPAEVDFMGIVLFFSKSRRSVSVEQAEKILTAVPSGIKKTAVTVSPTPEQVKIIEKAGFDFLQVHGNLSPEVLSDTSIPIIRAVNIKNGLPELENIAVSKHGFLMRRSREAGNPSTGMPFPVYPGMA